MKLKGDFITNSSSSSYVMWGIKLSIYDFRNKMKEIEESKKRSFYH